MRKFYLFSILFFILFSGISHAQPKKITCADAARVNPEVQPQRLRNLQWMGTSNNFAYIHNNDLIKGSSNSSKQETILRKDALNSALAKVSTETIKNFPSIYFDDNNNFSFTLKNTLFQYNLSEKNITKRNSCDEKAENIDIHRPTFRMAYTMGNNLFISINNEARSVTGDKSEFIVNGQSVHRSEFGIEKGTFWSPQGEKLAFYRMNEGMVTEYPIVDVSERIAVEKPIRYPMAGMTSHEVTVGIYDVATAQTIFLKPQPNSEKDQYWTNITWSPDEKYLYVAIVNRNQDRMEMCQFDVQTGDYLKTLFVETNKRYVEPTNGLVFLPGSSTDFIWQSRRDGFSHLYLSDIHGKKFQQLTSGSWEVLTFAGFDSKGENLFFTATKESPLESNIYKYDIPSGKITRISPDHGTHYPVLNKTGNMVLDIFSNTEVPYMVKIIDNKGKIAHTVFESPNPLKDYVLGEMTIDKIKSDNGVDLYYRLIKPVGFDANKKYPAIVYVYGGPHAQLITDSWLGGNDMFLFYLAQEGYVVFTIDNQGSGNRGFEFESIIHRHVGEQEARDQMTGINFLKQFPWVDQNRIGIDGWSYGGFMTINMLLTYPGVFKAGCAGGPVCDWKYYEVMYGERYMDTPEQNPEGYKNSSLIERAGQLKDNLLIIHGDQDPVVVWQNSLEFVKKCVDNEIQLDYFVYPGHEHNVRGKDRAHLYQKITSFFDRHLK